MIIFQKEDQKFKCLKEALLRYNIYSTAISGSPIKAPLILLRYRFGKRIKIVYVFRYLNDYPNFFKSFLRMSSEVLIILIAKIFNIKLWWLCHNVNKETVSNFPKLTDLRRRIIVDNVDYIFTTNELLIPYAKKVFHKDNIDSISLGFINKPLYENLIIDNNINMELTKWLKDHVCPKTKLIFCAGSNAQKVLHFDLIQSLLKVLNTNDSSFYWKAIVVGHSIKHNTDIFNIPIKYLVDSNLIRKYVNYYYRVIDDFSISYTLFESCYYEKPLITENYGFLPDVINFYNIGFIICRTDIQSFLKFIDIPNNFGFKRFLKYNNWDLTAEKIEYYYNK